MHHGPFLIKAAEASIHIRDFSKREAPNSLGKVESEAHIVACFTCKFQNLVFNRMAKPTSGPQKHLSTRIRS